MNGREELEYIIIWILWYIAYVYSKFLKNNLKKTQENKKGITSKPIVEIKENLKYSVNPKEVKKWGKEEE